MFSYLLLLDTPNVHPQLKKIQRKKANFSCKWCICFIEHALIIWDKIKTLQVPESVKSTRNNNNNKNTNKNN